jgi:glycosyltransferase involved in cell wall biosynthesis
MSDCLVTIITVALNEERRLPLMLKSIDSELTHGNHSIEVILVDNGSTDRTYEIMINYAKTHNNVKIMKIPGPLGYAYNEALKNAKCEFVLFLGADMYLPRGWLSRITGLIREYPECDAFVARLLPLFRFRGSLNDYCMAYFLGDTAGDGYWREPTFHSGGLLIKRDLAVKIGFKPLPSAEDGEFSFRFLRIGYRACYFPTIYYVLDEQYYDVNTMISYFRKLGVSTVILMRYAPSISTAKALIRAILEPLTPHYLVTRYNKASRYVRISRITWLLYGLLRLYAMIYPILIHGLLGIKVKGKITRTKL